jgi:hypothetical protein
MVAMALSLMLFGVAMTLLDELYNVCDLASSEADVNQNLRVAVNIIARDLATTGGGIPLGGIPLPGGGGATPINRPGPGVLGTNNFSASPNLNVITPGPGLGPPAGSTPLPTDEVTMITVNSSSQLNQSPLANINFKHDQCLNYCRRGNEYRPRVGLPGSSRSIDHVNERELVLYPHRHRS